LAGYSRSRRTGPCRSNRVVLNSKKKLPRQGTESNQIGGAGNGLELLAIFGGVPDRLNLGTGNWELGTVFAYQANMAKIKH